MSVTVADILKLPSLKRAKAVTGDAGLSRIISSVSVLEYAEPTITQDMLYRNNEFLGDEIVITAFASIKDDVEAQKANIRQLAGVGEVGLILYYVGIIMPRVDESLIALAKELDFSLIVMPENEPNQRYSEVICEVMEAIITERRKNTYLVTEILERLSMLPAHQRSMDAVLRMLSDRLYVSLVLTDHSQKVLNAVGWPRSITEEILQRFREEDVLPEAADPSALRKGQRKKEGTENEAWIRHFDIATEYQPMRLYFLSDSRMIDEAQLEQAAEVVQLSANLWGRGHSEVAERELVRAILQDEPVKMRRLADIFHIDVASLHEMWLLFPEKEEAETDALKQHADSRLLEELRRFLKGYSASVITDHYEDTIVIFMCTPERMEDKAGMTEGVHRLFAQQEKAAFLVCASRLEHTEDVRTAWLEIQQYLQDARKLFPLVDTLDLSDIRFVRDLREKIQPGKAEYSRIMESLEPLLKDGEDNEFVRTAEVYFLDAGERVIKTAELLFVHKNTIKYRLARCSELLGYRLGKQPQTMELYQALALHRLMYN
ncbi:MAG: PucR family transcriptional regulator ligand-binding domain-containing protein [Eubacteriales bacterium]|nr:PucR family transcriptional regulator ligand-binding domain-containing protein [Eubacteriales bacterium]